MVRRGSAVRVRDRAPSLLSPPVSSPSILSPSPDNLSSRMLAAQPKRRRHARLSTRLACRLATYGCPPSILVVTNMYPSGERPARGTFVASQVEALRRTGAVDVQVQAFDAAGKPWRYGVETLLSVLRRSDADIVHAHYGLSGPVALAAAGRRPVILTVHGRDCHHRLVKRVTAAAASRAAAVVAVSRELAAICPFPTTDVIPVGVDTERFRPIDRRQARRRSGCRPTSACCSSPPTPPGPRSASIAPASWPLAFLA